MGKVGGCGPRDGATGWYLLGLIRVRYRPVTGGAFKPQFETLGAELGVVVGRASASGPADATGLLSCIGVACGECPARRGRCPHRPLRLPQFGTLGADLREVDARAGAAHPFIPLRYEFRGRYDAEML